MTSSYMYCNYHSDVLFGPHLSLQIFVCAFASIIVGSWGNLFIFHQQSVSIAGQTVRMVQFAGKLSMNGLYFVHVHDLLNKPYWKDRKILEGGLLQARTVVHKEATI